MRVESRSPMGTAFQWRDKKGWASYSLDAKGTRKGREEVGANCILWIRLCINEGRGQRGEMGRKTKCFSVTGGGGGNTDWGRN